MNIVALNPKITPIIPCDDEVSDILPLSRSVELLIDVSVESEAFSANRPKQSQISIPFLEGIQAFELAIPSNHLRPRPGPPGEAHGPRICA